MVQMPYWRVNSRIVKIVHLVAFYQDCVAGFETSAITAIVGFFNITVDAIYTIQGQLSVIKRFTLNFSQLYYGVVIAVHTLKRGEVWLKEDIIRESIVLKNACCIMQIQDTAALL